MIVVLSPWGNPRGWNRVVYKTEKFLEELKREDLITCIKDAESITPLSVFEGCKEVKLVIFLPITLLDDEVDREKVKEEIIKSIKEIIDKKNDEAAKKIFDRSEKRVVLGTGLFRRNSKLKEFKVPFDAVKASLLINVYETIEGAKAVFLDVTHGLNYYPATLRVLINDLLQLQALKVNRVTLYTVSSDPVVGEEGVTVNYNLLEALNINADLSKVASMLMGLRMKNADDTKDVEELIRRARTILKVPSPLLWSYLFTEISSKKGIIQQQIENILNKVKGLLDNYTIGNGRLELKISKNVKNLFLTTRTLLALKSVVSVAKRYGSFQKVGREDVYVVKLEKLNELKGYLDEVGKEIWDAEKETLNNSEVKKKEDYLETIKEVLQLIDIHETKNYDIYEELCNDGDCKLAEKLKEKGIEAVKERLRELEEILEGGFVPYALVKNTDYKSALWWAVWDASSNKRNFVAHAGLEMNLTVVELKEGKVSDERLIGYYLPMLENMIKTLSE